MDGIIEGDRTAHVALLFNPSTAVPLKIYMPSIQAAASSLAIQASAAPVHAKDEIEGGIGALARNPGGGLVVMPDSFTTANRELISALAARYRAPAIHNASFFPESGGLIAFGTDFVEQFSPGVAHSGGKPRSVMSAAGQS
jgi:putative ABC transport system substrate-binding protein